MPKRLLSTTTTVLVFLSGMGPVAHAKSPSPAKTPSNKAASTPGPKGDLDFDLFGDSAKATTPQMDPRKQAELDRKIATRRRTLKAHQAFGFITLGALAATLVIGQLNYLDKFGRDGTYQGTYQIPHLGLAGASALTFSITGILALAAPNPYPKPIKADAALLHKLSMGLATAGMVAQMILGPISSSREGHLDQRDFALAHLIIGYGTFAAMTMGVFAFVF